MNLNDLTIASTRTAIAVSWILLLCTSTILKAQSNDDPSQQLQSITHALQNRTVTRIEILAIPKEVETLINVTPDRLQERHEVKVTIRNMDRARQSILEALKHTNAVPFDRDCDLRRGIVFYSQDSPIFTIYFDQFAQGQVNGRRAKFSGALVKWAETYIPSDYQ